MKNLKNRGNISNLPKREKVRSPEGWSGGHGTYHRVDGVYPWQRVKRLIRANIGKNFDKVFSEYCSQVPVYQQDFFLEEFRVIRRGWRYQPKYFIDKQGNIQKYKKEPKDKTVYFYSDDYETELRHKVTGAPYPEYKVRIYWKDSEINDDDYERVVVSGWFQKFSSKKDPEYIRLSTDQRKRFAAYRRKNKAEKVYSFISREEEAEKKSKVTDKVKIEAKGFDYLTSFRNEKALHPDIIKENQGF